MRWRSYHLRVKDGQEWHRWFAWRPVDVGKEKTIWLEFIERRKNFDHDGWHEYEYEWEYREIEN